MVSLHRAGGGGEGEQVVDRGGDLERALVAVAHHAGDPFGLTTRARTTRRSPPRACGHRALGPRMVVVVDRAALARQRARRRPRGRPRTGSSRRCRAGRARGCPGCGPPPRCRRAGAAKRLALGVAIDAAAIGVAAPVEIGAREIVALRPQPARRSAPAGRRRRRRASSRRCGGRRAARHLRIEPCAPSASRALGAHARGERVVAPRARRARRPRARRCRTGRSGAGKASRKKPEMRKVTSTRGRPKHGQRQDLEAGDAAGAPVPRRPHADQRQRLGDVVAAGAHVGGAPGRQADGAADSRRGPGSGGRAAASADCQPSIPGGRRRHGAGVDRVEIAPGRQHVEPAAGRRAGRAGRRRSGRRGRRAAPSISRRAAGARARGARSCVDHRRARRGAAVRTAAPRQPAIRRQCASSFQALDRIAVGAPRRRRRAPRAPPVAARSRVAPSLAVERIEARARDRRPGRGSARDRRLAPSPRGSARQRDEQIGARALPRATAPKTCRPSRIWHLLELAQVVVELAASAVVVVAAHRCRHRGRGRWRARGRGSRSRRVAPSGAGPCRRPA